MYGVVLTFRYCDSKQDCPVRIPKPASPKKHVAILSGFWRAATLLITGRYLATVPPERLRHALL